ncbi:hypothetical protein BDV96DRAFT_584928 [Lophiotrema nucula]|uniref:Uncharacterized protein n=1 Tax=Lophiotrema nucula TaxID=690887 RepID=A0A6A5YV81_9PLEO|nr:hypothetical protein BDV96DRAFT_584928 [Lophiotrema nucula]
MFSATHIFTFAIAALASPMRHQSRQVEIPTNWTWHVEGWEAGCVRRGCYFNFNITVPTVPNQIAGVKAYCSGDEAGYDSGFNESSTYRRCQILEGVNNGVAAKLGPRNVSDGTGRGPQKIFVSFELAGYQERPSYNFTGSNDTIYNAFVAPLQEFDITPTEVSAAA